MCPKSRPRFQRLLGQLGSRPQGESDMSEPIPESNKKTFAQKRLLKVRKSSTRRFRVSLQPISSSGKEDYVALSYCWGGDQPNKTTLATLQSHAQDMQWESLPRSIQDAVRVTLGLGFKWLWVDSLCIVQDDVEEMAQQIALMPRIYSEATLTIVASKAARATDGFLDDIDPLSGAGVAFKLSFSLAHPHLARGTVYALNLPLGGVCETPDPTDNRGWTFQERFLSSRLLEFRARQVRLICPRSYDPVYKHPKVLEDGWEVADHRLLAEFSDMTVAGCQEMDHHPRNSNSTQLGCHTYEEHWGRQFYNMAESYTSRKLSNPQDRILAISGVAEVFRQALSDEYLVGIWKRSLPFGLLWGINLNSRQSRPTHYQAPSWSWAAVNGDVHFEKLSRASDLPYLLQPSLKIQAHISVVEESAPCGAVRPGSSISGVGMIAAALWDGDLDLYEPREENMSHDRQEDDIRMRFAQIIPDACEKEFDGQHTSSRSEGGRRKLLAVHLLEIAYKDDSIDSDREISVGLVLRAEENSLPTLRGPHDRAYHHSVSVSRYSRLGLYACNWRLFSNYSEDEQRLSTKNFMSTFREEAFEIV